MRAERMAERLYRLLLRAYPADFRTACEDELMGYFRHDRSHPRYDGARGRLRFWRHTLADWARTAWSERRGGAPALPPGWSRRGLFRLPLHHAARSLRRDPAFTAVAVVTLAVGISATTIVFTLINGLLLTPLPLPRPDRLVQVEERMRNNPDGRMAAYANWLDIAAQSEAFEELALFAYDTKTLTGIDTAQRLRSRQVSENFFTALGVAPALGRTFRSDEMRDGQEQVVALSHALWSSAFAADPDILGRSVQLDATPHTVVAVMPEGFDFPFASQIWVPLVEPSDRTFWRRSHRFRMTGRLTDGADLAAAQQSLDLIGARLADEFPETNEHDYFGAYPLLDEYVGEARPVLRLLSNAVGLVLAIACVNIAGLSLARSTARRHEIAMRRALGASRGRLAALVVSEGIILGIMGGGLGLSFALFGLRALLALAAAEIPRVENVTIDATVFLFAAGASVLSALAASLLPLLHEARTNAAALVGSRSSATASAVLGRRALVVGEVAIAVVLVTAAGLLGRSFARLTAVQTGVVSENVLSMNIVLSNGKYPERIDTARFFSRVLPQIEAVPGVEAAAVTLTAPADPNGWRNSFAIRERPVPENEVPSVSYKVVSPRYFDTLGVAVIAGRGLTPADEEGDAAVTVINRTAAERFWPDGSPLGALVMGRADGDTGWLRVVGVVEDVRQSLYQRPIPEAYVPIAGDRVLSYVLVARTANQPGQYATAVQEALHEADPDIPVTRVESLDDRILSNVADARINATLMSTFGAIALALAAVGVYGVLSYSVSLRRREFGVRAAVGATRARVVRQVLGEALAIGALAVTAGIAAALLLGRLIAGMLFEVETFDPLTLTAVAVTVGAVTLTAALAPAWRAASSDPLTVLRGD